MYFVDKISVWGSVWLKIKILNLNLNLRISKLKRTKQNNVGL